jgi:multidrug efflux pump subunit AcrB
LVLLIGMATKTAVLIVDAAQHIKVTGVSNVRAAVSAVKVRIRAVLMTSIAFTFGVLPLFFSSGPGAGAKISISLPIIGGMIFLVAFAIFLVAYFYCAFAYKK